MARDIDEFDTIERSAVEIGGGGGSGGLCLMVSVDGRFKTYPLPERGELTLGRGSRSDIRIEHPSVSRRHAVLRLGARIEVEDLNSANGLRIQDRPLPAGGRSVVHVGEAMEVGEVMLVIRRATAVARPRRLWPHGYFEGRVEEQCARAQRSGETFAVLRLGVEGAPPGAIEEALGLTLRALDVLALYTPGEYEVLLVDTEAKEAVEVSRRLVSHLAGRGGRCRVGLAQYGKDGTTPDAIIARACDAVRGLDGEWGGDATQPGASAGMKSLRRLTEQVAGSDLAVLILGETGVGKEVLAESVHRLSPRAKGPFVKLHCAAFSDSLLESELFGHEKGAFTGAVQTKPGLLETAQGGTVLLDEIGELPPQTQVKLLRVLEERKVLRIGALAPRSIDVRFIAATNRDLDAEVAVGRFRRDLYYRLNGVSLVIPPLRERFDELVPLARTFLEQACRRLGKPDVPSLSHEALQRLHSYSWPGNIRELRNTIERAVLLCGRGPIGLAHLPTEKMAATLPAVAPRASEAAREMPTPQPRPVVDPARPATPRPETPRPETPPPERPSMRDLATPAPSTAAPTVFDSSESTRPFTRIDSDDAPPGALGEQIDALERQRILETLEQCGGNQTRAAKLLGISRGKLIARLDSYGIVRPRK